MHRKFSAKVASIGVTRTQLAVQEELGWLFREQPTEDYGIDAHVEVVDGHRVEGRLLALQIKSGMTWFRQPVPRGWWFRPRAEHVKYWLNHSLPVVVVLFHPGANRCYWQLVNQATLQKASTGEGWKILVPEEHVLNGSARMQLREAAEGDPYLLRMRQLRLARPWMDLLTHGHRVIIYIEEWLNKISGPASIALEVIHPGSGSVEKLATWGVSLGGEAYADVIPSLFPWADVKLHEETYRNSFYPGRDFEYLVDYEPFPSGEEESDEAEGVQFLPGPRPYANLMGEVDQWRLELTLNELGRAFMVVDDFGMNVDSLPSSSSTP